MFGFKKRPSNRLYEFVVPVTVGVGSRLPIDPEVGRVVCYAAAPNEEKAKDVAIQKLQIERCVVLPGWQSREVDPNNWASYVKIRWARSAPSLPSQEQVLTVADRGGLFFGPADSKRE